MIRIIALVNNYVIETHHCVIWSNITTSPEVYAEPLEIIRIHQYRVLRNSKYYPCLLTCKVPCHKGQRVLIAVSIVDDEAMKLKDHFPSNYIKVNFPFAEEKEDFAVCVKGYLVEDKQSARLVEWIKVR